MTRRNCNARRRKANDDIEVALAELVEEGLIERVQMPGGDYGYVATERGLTEAERRERRR